MSESDPDRAGKFIFQIGELLEIQQEPFGGYAEQNIIEAIEKLKEKV